MAAWRHMDVHAVRGLEGISDFSICLSWTRILSGNLGLLRDKRSSVATLCLMPRHKTKAFISDVIAYMQLSPLPAYIVPPLKPADDKLQGHLPFGYYRNMANIYLKPSYLF